MPYVYLTISVFMNASSSVLGKLFNRKNASLRSSDILYNFIMILSVFMGWGLMYALDFSFEPSVLIYSLMFGISYSACNIGIIKALKYGPAALTSLFISLSLILTTTWGLIFWDSEFSLSLIAGLVLVAISIILCVYTKEKSEKAISLKWVFFVCLAVFGNSGCSIIQRTQQVKYNGEHSSMLMLFAMCIAIFFSTLIFSKSDKSFAKTIIKHSWWMPVCAGVFNLILNVFVMILATSDLSPSLIYPVLGIGALAVVTVFSLLVFKEKMYPRQWVGMAIGALAILFLSI